MTHAAQYAAQVFPNRTRVMGVELLPVQIGHALLLLRLNSPFVAGGNVKKSDILIATWILSRDCITAAKCLHRRRTQWLLRWWGTQWRAMSGLNQLTARQMIETHVASAFRSKPPIWEADGEDGESKTRMLSAPSLLVMRVRLRHLFGATREESLLAPIEETNWEFAAYGDDQGAIDWLDEEDAAWMDNLG